MVNKISCSDLPFTVEGQKSLNTQSLTKITHTPTNGSSLCSRIQKLFYYLLCRFCDWVSSNYDTSKFDGVNYNFLNKTLCKRATLISNIDVMSFNNYLRTIKGSQVQFIAGGMGTGPKIESKDPCSVIKEQMKNDGLLFKDKESIEKGRISEKHEKEVKGNSEAEQKNKDEQQKTPGKKLLAYPFTYPSSGCSFPHIVLIIVDVTAKTIYYYDSKGLTSDDPAMSGMFSDNPKFNMHESLTKLAEEIFPDEGRVIENIAPHQTDAVNCGIFVMRALENLSKIKEDELDNKSSKAVIQALSFDPENDDILKVRRNIGKVYQEYLSTLVLSRPST